MPGVQGSLFAALGLAAILVEIGLLSVVRSLLRALPFEGPVSILISAAAGVVLWTSIPWLLLNRRLPWRRLVPAGVLTGTLSTLFGFTTTIYMPRLMTSYSERYGLFGITIALVGWLLAISFIVVVSTIVAAEVDRAPERWASWLKWPGVDRGADLAARDADQPARAPHADTPASTDHD